MFALFAVCLLHLRPSWFTRLLLFTRRLLPSLHLCFFFFSHPLSVSAVSLLSSLFKVSGFSVGFPIRHTRWCWKQEVGDPDWPALTSGVALSAAHFSFTLLRPLLTSRAFLFPHVSQGFYLLISCFSGIFSVIFFPLSSSLQCPHSPVPSLFYFHLPFFLFPTCILHPSLSSSLLHSFPPSFTIFNILCYDVLCLHFSI